MKNPVKDLLGKRVEGSKEEKLKRRKRESVLSACSSVITKQEIIDDIRKYLGEERSNINKKCREDKSYIPQAREVDRVVDNVDRRLRILESKVRKDNEMVTKIWGDSLGKILEEMREQPFKKD